MRRTLIILGCVGVLALLVLWVGEVLQLEYPHTFTLMRARSAVSVSGVPVSQIVGTGLHWHTCGYCADAFGSHKGLTLVRLEKAGTASYYFAYCRATHVLVPLMERTAQRFPSLMPPGDELRPVGELDGTGRTSSFGEGELRLPGNWYRTVTGAEPGGKTGRS
jgi:hypothetical protein